MKAIVLAAGQSRRLRSSLSKVMQPILGKTVVQYVVESAMFAGIDDITVIVGNGGDAIKAELSNVYPHLHFTIQDKQLGTGHAVMAGMGRVSDTDDVLVLCGDMPLVTSEFVAELVDFYKSTQAAAVIAAVHRPDLGSFGRVYTDENGMFREIIEYRDMKPDSADTEWANTGICIFNGGALRRGLSQVGNANNQNEYYLTDVPKIMRDEGLAVRVFESYAGMSVFTGISTQIDLAEATAHMQDRINAQHMLNGVRMIDPTSVYIDSTVEIGPDVVLYPGVILEGGCNIAAGVVIGAHSHLKDTIVGEGAIVRQSVAINAIIGAGTEVGPFAYLRPEANIGDQCKVGSFVEIKKSTIGTKSKVPHLSYVGDTTVGSGVNIGCGVITANYDGKNKHNTIIEDDAFIGSNVNLIAPVTIGAGAVVAAGSTVTKNVTSCALCIARARQEEKPDWAKNRR